ncbi:MAG: hypothetical protein R3263_05585, partial [Myxococcota bacterium]|nr:hypothetical protein [Myxococcota bacterium]
MAPRDLGDVLHWFLDPPARAPRGAPSSVFVLTIGVRDVLRAAFAWNLAAALAQRRPGTALGTRAPPAGGLRWPGAGPARLIAVLEPEPAALARAAHEAAGSGAPVLTCVPPEALTPDAGLPAPGERGLVFATPDEVEGGSATARIDGLRRRWPQIAPGVVIHGVSQLAAARRTFERLAERTERRHRVPLVSYGLLLDD